MCRAAAVFSTKDMELWMLGMHACNDANVYNKQTTACMYENVCSYLLYVHLHFSVYQMRDETWLARIGLHFPITCTSFKSDNLSQLNLSEFVTPCFIRGIVVDYSLVDTLHVLGFVLLTFF